MASSSSDASRTRNVLAKRQSVAEPPSKPSSTAGLSFSSIGCVYISLFDTQGVDAVKRTIISKETETE